MHFSDKVIRTSRTLKHLALAGFEPALGLVDNVDPALTAHDAAIAVALLERAE